MRRNEQRHGKQAQPGYYGCALTSKIHKKEYLPTHVFLNGYKSTGLERCSLALCEQITSVAFPDILEVADSVSERKLAETGYAVKIQCRLAA